VLAWLKGRVRPRRALLPALALVALLGGALAGGLLEARARYAGPGPLPEARAIVVPRGSPTRVAEALLAAGAITSPLALRIAAWLTSSDGPLRAGEFLFPSQASLREVLSVLRQGRPVQHRLTIPEGLTAAAIATLLDRTDTLAGDAVVPAEGTTLPETYLHERGTTRAALAERAARAMDRALAEAWANRAPGLPLASPTDLLILASIVERETGKAEERPRVAQVFINRLNRGMRLQSDPTVVYAASGGLGTLDRPISRADLDAPNPYNTYRNAGLPPGPIASPGTASLAAVARPSGGDDLYFVADGTGGHAFATTLDEHNRNVAKWRALNK
jgi:UPF0755 protein